MQFLNQILKMKYPQLLIKLTVLIVFLLLMIIGLSAHSSDAALLKQLRNTNLANLLVWSYWWPTIIILSILFGRVWCMVCPIELLTSISSKLGLRKKRPQFIKSGQIISIFYILVLVVGIKGFAIHRNPTYMAYYLITIMGLSILSGLIYKKNTFCRYMCPVGNLLGLYSKISAWGWGVKDSTVCISCQDRSCTQKDYRYSLISKNCNLDLRPLNTEENSNCILCSGCLNSCSDNKIINNKRPNPGIVKIGLAKGLYTKKSLNYSEWTFLFVLSGFVIYEILSEFKVSKEILLFLPKHLIKTFEISSKIGTTSIISLHLFLLVPALFWFIPYLLLKLQKETILLRDYLLNIGLAFIPIVAGAHFCKAILKMSSRIPYFTYIIDDYTGLSVARAIVSGQISLTKLPSFAYSLITITIFIILTLSYLLSLKVLKRQLVNIKIINNQMAFQMITLPYFLVFFICLVYWRVIG
jgi:polyferredoxin